MRLIIVACVCAGLCVVSADAQTPPKADDDLNDLMALRAKVMVEAHQLQMEIRQMGNDPAYTSPEIEKLRKALLDLQDAILRTQGEIQKKVEELPQVKVKVKQMEEANKTVEELNKKIKAKQGTD